MNKDSKFINLKTWIKDASDVWTAIRQNEDLMMIQDLAEINNSRKIV